jgi:hypothetical protein
MRAAHIVATGGHLAAYTVIARSRAAGRLPARGSRVLSVHSPLPELVERHRWILHPSVTEKWTTARCVRGRRRLADVV